MSDRGNIDLVVTQQCEAIRDLVTVAYYLCWRCHAGRSTGWLGREVISTQITKHAMCVRQRASDGPCAYSTGSV